MGGGGKKGPYPQSSGAPSLYILPRPVNSTSTDGYSCPND